MVEETHFSGDLAAHPGGFFEESHPYAFVCRITAPPCKDEYELREMKHPIWIMRDEGRLAKGLAKEAGEGWSYPFWSRACDLFVYLNVHFRSYQFEEEVTSTFVANIHHRQRLSSRPTPSAIDNGCRLQFQPCLLSAVEHVRGARHHDTSRRCYWQRHCHASGASRHPQVHVKSLP